MHRSGARDEKNAGNGTGKRGLFRPPVASFEVERQPRSETRRLIKEVEAEIHGRRYGEALEKNDGKSGNNNGGGGPENGHKAPVDWPDPLLGQRNAEKDAEIICVIAKFDHFLETSGLRDFIAEGLEDGWRQDRFDSPSNAKDFFQSYFLDPRVVIEQCALSRIQLYALMAEKERLREENAKVP